MPGPATGGATPERDSRSAPVLATPSPLTRIVGLGASAGGLLPLEAFLTNVPPSSGMAYVVVQHLDPTHKALLGELLARVTPMPVREAEQDMAIQADHVYVISPGTELSVVGNALKLDTPSEARGLRLPIDVLFSSMARARGERAIVVLLSGMGADGTLGMQAVKAIGGLTLVQTPETAQFDAMPRSAIAAGCADIIAPADAMARRIVDFVAGEETHTAVAAPLEGTTLKAPLQRIFDGLQRRTRHDFSMYKLATVQRRIERRMNIHRIAIPAEYADYLEANPQEVDLLFKELLIGVTRFFRDAEAWEHLARAVLPEFLGQKRQTADLRAWVVGCSTGEEAYGLAMVFTEAIARTSRPQAFTLKIFASDLSPDAIASARRGQYPLSIRDSMSPERLARFFDRHESHYQIKSSLRDTVLFAQHDVVLDPPFTKLDLITCRNLLIYFDPMLQRRLMPLFHYSLRPGGILFLGSSETVGRFDRLFAPIHSRLRIYRRQDAAITGRHFLLKSFPPLSRIEKEQAVASDQELNRSGGELQRAADDVLLQVYAPAAVLLNADGDIVYISGRTGKFLEPAAGKANWNIHAMAREGLRAPLLGALRQSRARREPLHLHGVPVAGASDMQRLDVTVQTFHDPGPLLGMAMVVFRDVDFSAASDAADATAGESAVGVAALRRYQDEIETLREEARASREELQTANEELQSTNEELQSTNEELMTSKEEMQSMNEELQTINNEMQTKLDDLALAQSDMQNVLNSIEIAILFLDQNLNVRRFTDRAAKIISLRDSDVGRPVSDLTTKLQYPGLLEDAQETLRRLKPSEKEVEASDGRSFSVRIMPYRRIDNVIDGLVITLLVVSDRADGDTAPG